MPYLARAKWMGVWGVGSFENDDAVDWLNDWIGQTDCSDALTPKLAEEPPWKEQRLRAAARRRWSAVQADVDALLKAKWWH
jgi:hypothetical protein